MKPCEAGSGLCPFLVDLAHGDVPRRIIYQPCLAYQGAAADQLCSI